MARIILDLTDEETEVLLRQVAQPDKGPLRGMVGDRMSQQAESLQTKVEQAVKNYNEYAEFEKRITAMVADKMGVSVEELTKRWKT